MARADLTDEKEEVAAGFLLSERGREASSTHDNCRNLRAVNTTDAADLPMISRALLPLAADPRICRCV